MNDRIGCTPMTIAIGVTVIILALFYVFSGLPSEYSNGERTGIPIKMSYKGIFCKTYEGQLNLGGIVSSGDKMVSNVWNFTVQDEAMVKQIDAAAEKGQRVQIAYTQPLINSPCKSSSGYMATSIKVLSQ